jgi:hypothetical protein
VHCKAGEKGAALREGRDYETVNNYRILCIPSLQYEYSLVWVMRFGPSYDAVCRLSCNDEVPLHLFSPFEHQDKF